MDNYCFPIVYLNTTHYDDDESIFNIIGGDGRWTLFHMMVNGIIQIKTIKEKSPM